MSNFLFIHQTHETTRNLSFLIEQLIGRSAKNIGQTGLEDEDVLQSSISTLKIK